MLLGDILARFDDEVVATEAILGLQDIALIARLREQAEASGQTLGAYACGAVGRYAAEAGDEEWLSLIGAAQRASDPGAVCLKRILTHGLLGAPVANTHDH